MVANLSTFMGVGVLASTARINKGLQSGRGENLRPDVEGITTTL